MQIDRTAHPIPVKMVDPSGHLVDIRWPVAAGSNPPTPVVDLDGDKWSGWRVASEADIDAAEKAADALDAKSGRMPSKGGPL